MSGRVDVLRGIGHQVEELARRLLRIPARDIETLEGAVDVLPDGDQLEGLVKLGLHSGYLGIKKGRELREPRRLERVGVQSKEQPSVGLPGGKAGREEGVRLEEHPQVSDVRSHAEVVVVIRQEARGKHPGVDRARHENLLDLQESGGLVLGVAPDGLHRAEHRPQEPHQLGGGDARDGEELEDFVVDVVGDEGVGENELLAQHLPKQVLSEGVVAEAPRQRDEEGGDRVSLDEHFSEPLAYCEGNSAREPYLRCLPPLLPTVPCTAAGSSSSSSSSSSRESNSQRLSAPLAICHATPFAMKPPLLLQ